MKSNFGLPDFVRLRIWDESDAIVGVISSSTSSFVRGDFVQFLLGQVEQVIEKAEGDPDLDGDDGDVRRRRVTVRVQLSCEAQLMSIKGRSLILWHQEYKRK